MMKSEFESLAGRNVTDEQYKAIETLYMSSNLEKAEFVKSIRTMLKSIPQPEKKKDIKRMAVRDRSGYRKTPNGCYYHIEYVELVDIDIKTGKYIIKPLEDKDFEQLAKDGHDLNLNTWFNFDYEDCIDEKGNSLSEQRFRCHQYGLITFRRNCLQIIPEKTYRQNLRESEEREERDIYVKGREKRND